MEWGILICFLWEYKLTDFADRHLVMSNKDGNAHKTLTISLRLYVIKKLLHKHIRQYAKVFIAKPLLIRKTANNQNAH